MNPETARALGVGAVVAAAITAAIFLFPRAFTLAAGPEVELITLLKKAESRGLELEIGDAGTLYSEQAFFERMQVTVDAADKTARVNCTLDFTGRLGATRVSSLGLERIGFKAPAGDDWKPVAGLAPRLARVVWALELRRRALESGDAAQLARLVPPGDAGAPLAGLEELLAVQNRRYRATAWLIRFEREGATVTEDYRLEGDTAEQPIDKKGSVRLFVDPGGEFFFPQGLM